MGDESSSQFEKRKQDHLKWSLDEASQTRALSDLNQIELIHEALPEMNLAEVSTETSFFSHKLSVPFFVSSMTAGHSGSLSINSALASLSERKQILVGIGSQRKQLWDEGAQKEWFAIRKKFPNAILAGNLGLAQLIQSTPVEIQKLIDSLGAQAFFIHTNPLQEALQNEGTPQFKGGLKALGQLCKALKVPVILKEVGCGFSAATLEKIKNTGVAAVDVSGRGGTHWGRIEGARFETNSAGFQIAETFSDWGLGTLDSLISAVEGKPDYQIWASGGVRDGLDIAKLLAVGAQLVGLAQPWLKALLQTSGNNRISLGQTDLAHDSADLRLDQYYGRLQQELKIAMFCTGCQSVSDFSRSQKVWKWRKSLKM